MNITFGMIRFNILMISTRQQIYKRDTYKRSKQGTTVFSLTFATFAFEAKQIETAWKNSTFLSGRSAQ